MKRCAIFIFLFITSSFVYAALYQEGRDYAVIANHHQQAAASNIEVIEFFSYGCPWCYKLESNLKSWQKSLPKQVNFSRVPVIFERSWDVYAKAYYTAVILGINHRLTPALFNEIQVKGNKLNTNEAMMNFFIQSGVEEKIAKSAFFSSPTINERVRMGILKMQQFQIRSVPSIVINGHYRVDVAMAGGDTVKFFNIVDFLIAKELVLDMQKNPNA